MPFGAPEFAGWWNADTNEVAGSPVTKGLREFLQPGRVPTPVIYQVIVAGSTNLDGISSWAVGDWAVNYGFGWGRFVGGANNFAGAVEAYLQSRPTTLPSTPGVIWWNGNVLSRS